MSIESLWYQSYRDGRPPKQNRLSRLPEKAMNAWGIALALDYHRGLAGWHGYVSTVTMEQRWWWPTHTRTPLSGAEPSEWWLLPNYVVAAMRSAMTYATHAAQARSAETGGDLDTLIEIELRRLAKRARSPKGVTPVGHIDRDLRVPPTRTERFRELDAAYRRNMAERLNALGYGVRVAHDTFGSGIVICSSADRLPGETVLVRFDDGIHRRILSYPPFLRRAEST